MSQHIILGICLSALWLSASSGDEPESIPSSESSAETEITESTAVDFVRAYCIDCHGTDGPEADLNLEAFRSTADVVAAIRQWRKVADRVRQGEMPPEDSELPPAPLRKEFVAWIQRTIHAAICDDGLVPGPPMLRRLNRTEYANTIRDLLGIHINAGHALPADGAGGEGFDNAAETLFISPIHAEKYLDAAKSALDHAFKDPAARKRIITVEPNENRPPPEAAKAILSVFLRRAFRRPVRDTEIGDYVALFETAFAEAATFDAAMQFALQAALVSPRFLFLWEEPTQEEMPVTISQFEMAARLSYFLWASMPDSELFTLAEQGKLHDEAILAEQVARMLRSDIDQRGLRRGAKVRDFAASFIEQWLGTRALGREFKPGGSFARHYDSELQGGMRYEPIFFFEDLLADNRSLLNLIDSDFTYVNRRLARHYGISGEFREQPKRVELPQDSKRGGVLGMGAVLAVSSHPHRTSPVLRGKWILETLLGTPPPPPPPNVSQLAENTDSEQPVSLRERLELHRAHASCAACHATIDPLGFGLENFDVLGRWRTEVDGIAVDARGELPDGTVFEGPDALKDRLLERKDQFIRNLTSKLLGYALARGLTNEDDCTVETMIKKLKQDDYKSQTLILEIVKSVPFRFKQGNNALAPVAGD